MTVNSKDVRYPSFKSRFIEERDLGSGKFGKVFTCCARNGGKQYAAKVNHDRDVALKEARMLQLCGKHPNCVTFLGLYSRDDDLVIMLELCAFPVWSKVADRSMLLPSQFASQAMDILHGLAHLQSVQLAHRDIKAANILYSSWDGPLKIADFGLATRIPPGQKLQRFCGSSSYMSPEMLAGMDYDFKTDVWSAGVLLYLMVFWIFPYSSEDSSIACVKSAVLERQEVLFFLPGPAEEVWGIHLEELVEFINKLLVFDDSERPSAREALTLVPGFKAQPRYLRSSKSEGMTCSSKHGKSRGAYSATSRGGDVQQAFASRNFEKGRLPPDPLASDSLQEEVEAPQDMAPILPCQVP